MAMDLRGITNENEFYTHHYLAAIMEGDLKPVFEAWAQQEQSPADRLRELAKPFQTMRKAVSVTLDNEERLGLQRTWFGEFFDALGYPLIPENIELEDGTVLSLAGAVRRANGEPELWILEAPSGEDEDPLAALDDMLTKQIFGAPEPPRWVLLYGGTQLSLLERTKWPAKRWLRFDLEEILGRRENSTLRATAALLHRESVCPSGQISLLDRLDENSHKHAFSVSEDLKYSAREAVELLGNEAVWYLREVLKEGIYGKDLAQQLTRECLRYLYRLLFLFYVEARPELGYAPMNSEEYLTGYSLESLRDAAELEISTEEDRNGFFLHNSLQALFKLVFDGWRHELQDQDLGDHNFRMEPLRCDLFDPARTSLLNRVRMRNKVLQRVIELLSLSREGRGRRGRISYSQLGINQLGAVYEGLLSYTGFFVEENDGLFEVKPKDDDYDPLKQAYFVAKDALGEYEEEEKVFANGRLVHHPKGEFVYRLAGRNRQKSASYYTPDVLTQCVVKYALKELLKDKTADDILRLNVCEPALGSGAFLNEAVNQLADAYLELKQRETGWTIAHDLYLLEKQKVKAYLADNRVYGVDRNPIAIELAEVSLWLNTIYAHHTIPWFGGQLIAGNSLIGARRQVFHREDIESDNRAWLDTVPERVPVGQPRPEGRVWHFLLPDKGMADYTDKAVKEMLPEEMKRIRKWRREFAKRFEPGDFSALERLSLAVDRLWQKHAADLRSVRTDTEHVFPIFGQESNPKFTERGHRLTTHERDEIFTRAISPGGGQSSAYQRLRLAMDYWCALWFWPLDKTEMLPSREEYLVEISAILEGTDLTTRPILGAEQEALFQTGKPEQEQFRIVDESGTVDLESLCARLPRVKLVREIARRHRFMHWELEFADLFHDHGGFDLTLGNPPWIKFEWNEGDVLGDVEASFILHRVSAANRKPMRESAFKKYSALKNAYLDEYVELAATQNWLNARQNFPLLGKSQPNSYKCFVLQAWFCSNKTAVQGFLHPDGIYDDRKGGPLRSALYPRLRLHCQFQNELPLFSDLGDREKFSINIYGIETETHFDHISNLFHPSTIDSSFEHQGIGTSEGVKTSNGEWNTAGHLHRIIKVDEGVLKLFARLYDEADTPASEAPLPSLHSQELLRVLELFAGHKERLGDHPDTYITSVMWEEAKRELDGTILRQTQFPKNIQGLVLSGPHISVANPLFKTPRRVCAEKSHYDLIDLLSISADYLPRTNFVPACEPETYVRRTTRVPWDDRKPVTAFFRLAARKMLDEDAERTLMTCIVPIGSSHIDACITVAFRRIEDLICFSAVSCSLPLDFLIKSTGKSNFRDELLKQLPWITKLSPALKARCLLLNCVTEYFSELWSAGWDDAFRHNKWSKKDLRLCERRFKDLASAWCWDTPLRCDYERRQALLEIDVIVAMALGLTLEDLCRIYRLQFSLLRQYENNTYYDQKGRIVYLYGDSLYGLRTPEWQKVREMTSGTVIRTVQDDTLPGGPRERTIEYVAPFDCCDREADYATAWAFFDREGL
jgi:hypothetical protein